MSAFHDYVRGISDVVPAGYSDAGMRLYRHLVYLGAVQMLESHYPQVKTALGEDQWASLVRAFVRDSRWESHYYGDLTDDFVAYLEKQSA